MSKQQYAVTNAYDIKDNLKRLGATWDRDRRAWIIDEDMLDTCNSRTTSYGMAWMHGWAKAQVEAI